MGMAEGVVEGKEVGNMLGLAVGSDVGVRLGILEGVFVGGDDGNEEGEVDGWPVGLFTVGSLYRMFTSSSVIGRLKMKISSIFPEKNRWRFDAGEVLPAFQAPKTSGVFPLLRIVCLLTVTLNRNFPFT